MKGRTAIIIAFLFALIAAFAMRSYLIKVRDQYKDKVSVLTAKNDITAFEVIEEANVSFDTKILSEAKQQGAITEEELQDYLMTVLGKYYDYDISVLENLKGAGLYAAVPIMKGNQVLLSNLGHGLPLTGYKPSSMISENMCAVTIAVDDVTGVAGNILSGDAVDVIGVFKVDKSIHLSHSNSPQTSGEKKSDDGGGEKKSDDGGGVTLTSIADELQRLQTIAGRAPSEDGRQTGALVKLLIDDARVLWAGREIRFMPSPAEGTKENMTGSEKHIMNVTLEVSEEEAKIIVLAQEIGTLTLVLESKVPRLTAQGFDRAKIISYSEIKPEDFVTEMKVSPPIVRRKPVWKEDRSDTK